MAIRNRLIFWMCLGALLIAALSFAFWPRAILVDVAEVSSGPMAVSIDEEGETRVKDVFTVSAPVTGEMERVTLEPGDRVIEGETKLTIIRPSSSAVLDQRTEAQLQAGVQMARSAIGLAESDIERVTADYNFASNEQERLRVLYARDYVSKAAYEKAEALTNSAAAALHAAEAALRMRRSELQMARSALMPRMHKTSDDEHIDLKAVINGVVLQIMRESAGPIQQGTPIMEIGNARDIEIVVDLLSEDAVAVAPGDPVIITGWGGEPVSGKVRLIEPFAFTKVSALGIEEQRVNVIIDFENVSAAAGLGHGFRVDIAVVTWQAEDVLSVPMTALFKVGTEWSVYTIHQGRAKLQALEVGHMNGRRAEIISGLTESDRVIEHPSDRIENKARVTDRREG